MKSRITILLVALLAPIALAGTGYQHSGPTSPAFDKMKSLVGEWKATVPGIGEVTASYTLHSDGSALLETLSSAEGTMITVYYPTAKGIAMTHYCSSHNQPSMQAKGTDGNALDFKVVSVANLASKDDPHMSALNVTFKDNDHFTAAWTHSANGKNDTMPFEFTRVK